MMWSVLIVLITALSVDAYVVHDLHERLAHGRQLKIYLPKSVERLEFTPADAPGKTSLYWEKGSYSKIRGRVSGSGSDQRWYIDKVTYEDQGTYVQRDFWNKEISSVKVAVIPRRNYVKCVAGESLYISLEGIDLGDAVLSFSGEAANVTLVRDGARVSQDLPDYWDRVHTHSANIEIRNVNVTDEGRYTLKDRRDRVVSVTRMDLTDHHPSMGGNPLMALLLLLGIPAGICCCCRKKIFKSKANTAATVQMVPEAVHPPPGPVGPCPPYANPGQPGAVYYHGPDPNMGPVVNPPPQPSPGQWNGPPPSPGFNPVYPPPNAAYPPAAPATFPPGPAAPMAYGPGYTPAPAPVMYSAPPPTASTEPAQISPTDPLLTATPQDAVAASSPVAPSTDNAYTFKLDDKTTNFL